MPAQEGGELPGIATAGDDALHPLVQLVAFRLLGIVCAHVPAMHREDRERHLHRRALVAVRENMVFRETRREIGDLLEHVGISFARRYAEERQERRAEHRLHTSEDSLIHRSGRRRRDVESGAANRLHIHFEHRFRKRIHAHLLAVERNRFGTVFGIAHLPLPFHHECSSNLSAFGYLRSTPSTQAASVRSLTSRRMSAEPAICDTEMLS